MGSGGVGFRERSTTGHRAGLAGSGLLTPPPNLSLSHYESLCHTAPNLNIVVQRGAHPLPSSVASMRMVPAVRYLCWAASRHSAGKHSAV